jgi:hypothetical protein
VRTNRYLRFTYHTSRIYWMRYIGTLIWAMIYVGYGELYRVFIFIFDRSTGSIGTNIRSDNVLLVLFKPQR